MELQAHKQRPYRDDHLPTKYRCGVYGYPALQRIVEANYESEAKRKAAEDFRITPKAVWVKKLKKDK